MIYRFHHFYVPDRMMAGLRRYVDDGIAPGSFLEAVICNDLRSAVASADEENMRNLPAFVSWLYNEAPGGSWGSEANMEAWMKAHHERRQQKRADAAQNGGVS